MSTRPNPEIKSTAVFEVGDVRAIGGQFNGKLETYFDHQCIFSNNTVCCIFIIYMLLFFAIVQNAYTLVETILHILFGHLIAYGYRLCTFFHFFGYIRAIWSVGTR